VLRAAADEHADLFWALRGGGGNFGVVTSFEFDLVELDPMVQFGLFFWDLEHGAAALRLARDIVATLPDDLNVILAAVNAPPAPFVPEGHRLQPGYALLLAGFDGSPGFDVVADRIRRDEPALFDVVTPMPYVQLQQLFDDANPFGVHCYDKGLYLPELTDDVIAVITEHVERKQSPESVLFLYRLDGAYSRVGEDDTAFGGGRSPRFTAFILGMGWSPDVMAGEERWVRSFWEGLSPHAVGAEAYLNGEAEVGQERVRASYGHKLDRLARVKATYDPDNVFHRTANIRPAIHV
jgi:FAD/FMN-containing dehydrogenase